jgi:hypothetical protein
VGGGGPGLAVFALLALLLVLAGAALISLRPWESDSVTPHLQHTPRDDDIGLDDAVALPPAREGAGKAVQVSVGRSASVPETVKVSTGGSGGQKLGVSVGHPVGHSAPGPVSPAPVVPAPAPTPVALPEPEPAPGAEVVPVATTTPPTSSPGAVTAAGGAPEEGAESSGEGPEDEGGETTGIPVCEGEEYVVVAFFDDEAGEDEEATVDIVIHGLEDEVDEGDIHLDDLSLDEAHSLIDLLVFAGECELVEPGLPS